MNILWRRILGGIIVGALLGVSTVYAVGSSNNYRIDEDFIGGGGLIEESSANYKAAESIGDIGVGNSTSTNFQTNSGYTTTPDPTLTFIVNSSSVSLSSLSSTVAATGTATFSVYNYTSYGYIVQIVGTSLTNSPLSYTIPALATQTASSPGTEQFGVNTVANTSPSVGASPAQSPDATFSFGTSSPSYNTTNQFRYVSGDTIAQATKTSGKTDFTISFLANVKPTTPAAVYTASQQLICTGTY